MKTRKITLTNDIHNTSVNVRVPDHDGQQELTYAQTRRVRQVLCGMSDCRCGLPESKDYDVEESTDRSGRTVLVLNSDWELSTVPAEIRGRTVG